ncbi:MAG: Kae1-associated kinase Bud32 [Thermoproteales archaeon]|nr:Kae1-associated kinase Bud32 [Thermoproteales archaeon]
MEKRLSSLINEIENIKKDIHIHSVVGIGAEAILLLSEWMGYRSIVKYRYSKRYRNYTLDVLLRKRRTVREGKIMITCKKIGIPVPSVLYIDDEQFIILMEYIDGIVLRDINISINLSTVKEMLTEIGEYIGIMHKNNIIHGDLTLANIILKEGSIFFIDFGLSEFSNEIEKQGVDLHIFMRALESMWPSYSSDLTRKIFEGYANIRGQKTAKRIKDKIIEIRRRGRYVSERRKNI